MIGSFVQVSAMLGNEERIVSGAAKIFPKIRTNDNKSGMLGSSVEMLIASKTQVVFGPVGMLFGENSKTQLAVVKIDKLATIKEIQDSFIKIAEIWGEESVERAREFNAYFNKNVEFVKEKTAEIGPKIRKRLDLF